MRLKKTIYVALVMVLGLILSFIAHAIIEIFYINYSLSRGIILKPSALTPKCYLPSVLQIFLIFAGLIGGYFLGQKWWTKIYGEK
jgi:Zn-dependent protease with chaperone function